MSESVAPSTGLERRAAAGRGRSGATPERLRIGLVYRHFNLSGSLPRFHVELARGLCRRGHEVHVFAIGETCEEGLAPDCTFHHVPVRTVGDGRGYCLSELWSFARNCAPLVERERARLDVVHARTPSCPDADVVHVSGVARAVAARGGVTGARWIAGQARHPVNVVRSRLERQAIRDAHVRRFHADAPQVAADLQQRYRIEPDRIAVVVPGVDLELFTPAGREAARSRLGLPSGGRIVCFCGHDFARKGLDRAIDAVARLESEARLVVVGNGEQAPYRAQADRLGISEAITFVGARTDPQLFLRAADVFVLPTREDVWGATVVEAMACGTVPIVSSVAGSSRAIDHGRTGIVLEEPPDAEGLAREIDDLLADDAKRGRLGAAAERAAQRYSWTAHVDAVERDLVALVAGRRGAPVRARAEGSAACA